MTLIHPTLALARGLSYAASCLMSVSATAAGTRNGAAPQAPTGPLAAELIGHWRHTRISYGGVTDHHLVLNADGSAESWTVTAEQRSARDRGRWHVDGRMLTLFEADGRPMQAPFTFHEGRLVLPNLTDQRRFWERLRG